MSAADELAALYAEIPAIACKRKCFTACGLVDQMGLMAPAEAQRLAFFGRAPDPTDPLACHLLDHETKLCRVYERRPMICRLWGVVDAPYMRCPYGCVPERWLTDAESRDLLRRAGEIQP